MKIQKQKIKVKIINHKIIINLMKILKNKKDNQEFSQNRILDLILIYRMYQGVKNLLMEELMVQ